MSVNSLPAARTCANLLPLREVRLRYYCGRRLVQAEDLQNQQEAVGIEQELSQVVELHHICRPPSELKDNVGGRRVHSRDILNHFKVRRRMADTAFDVISRCRATSISSNVAGLGGDWSSAARTVSYSQQPGQQLMLITHGKRRLAEIPRLHGVRQPHCLWIPLPGAT